MMQWVRYDVLSVCCETCENARTDKMVGNTLVRLMYQNETKASFARGDSYDGNCPKKLVCSGANGAMGAKSGGASPFGRLDGFST
jgi:hypothetical protein